MVKFNVAEIHCCTENEGPYKRVAIWFQGCDILCKNCCNPHLQLLEKRNIITLAKLVDIIKECKENHQIEGVTFLGGEPTLQQNLYLLAKNIQEFNLGVILFTGKNLNRLDENLIQHCDIIIDGEFEIENLDTSRNLIGSSNQNIHYISNRYTNIKEWFLEKRVKKVHVEVNDNICFSGDVY